MLINPLNRPQSIGQFIGLLNAPTVTGTSCSEEEGTILSNNSSNEDTLVIVKEQEIETQLNKKSIRDAIEDKAITPRTPKHKKKTVYWLLAIIIAVGIVGLVLKYTVNMPTSLPTTSSPAIDDDVKDYLESTDIKESDSNLWNAFINAFIAQLPEEPLFDIVTSMGTITVKLYSGTPRHRYNFEKLALAGYYNGLLFHRVINGFIIQGGDPLTREENDKEKWGTGGPGYTIDAEFIPEYKHKRGALAAARLGDAVNRMKRSSGSQFYLVQDATSCAELDGEYTVFGETLPECLGVIDKIAEVETDKRDCPINNVRIITIKYHNSTDY